MNRKQFIESQGATCKNWNWRWSFVNEGKRFVIFGAWDRLISGRRAKIFSKDWVVDAKSHASKGFKQSLQRGLVTLQRGLVTLQRGLVTLQRGLVTLQRGLVTLQRGFVTLQNGFAGLQNVAEGLENVHRLGIAAPAEKIYRALTTKAGIQAWRMAKGLVLVTR
jgi:hypothetical protein